MPWWVYGCGALVTDHDVAISIPDIVDCILSCENYEIKNSISNFNGCSQDEEAGKVYTSASVSSSVFALKKARDHLARLRIFLFVVLFIYSKHLSAEIYSSH